MSRAFLSGIDLKLQQLVNVVLHTIAGDSSSTTNGTIWHNSSTNKIRARLNGSNVTLVSDGSDLPAGSVANSALTTNPLARANHTGSQLAATISDFDTQVRTSRLDQMAAPTASVSLNTQKITNLVDPTSAQEAATKNYVDGLIQGFAWKQPVRVASTANITVASGLTNGSTIDGVSVATGDRVLLKNQTAQAENGIWVVVASGAASRATDADTAAEVLQLAVYVMQGTAAGDSQWVNTTNAPITLGTTALVFAQAGGGTGVTAGNGLTGTTVLSVVADTGISVSGSGVAIDTAVVARKYVRATIGDGSATSITVTHNLGTRAVIARLFYTASTYDEVECDIQHATTNTLTLLFGAAPATNEFTIVVIG